jgi:hypothetical protein
VTLTSQTISLHHALNKAFGARARFAIEARRGPVRKITVSAAPAIGLAGDKTLVLFDTNDARVTKTMDAEGVERLPGVDFRPAGKTVIGVTEDHRVHPDTREVTVDGKLAFEKGDAGEGPEGKIAAAAYINSNGKPEKTAMFNIDAGNKTLVQQTRPNDGTLKTIGKLEISECPETCALDIHGQAEGRNTAYLAGDNTICTVNPETGAATKLGTIEKLDSNLRDIAILPAS